jgi:integrase/recombinase XerD
MDIVIYTRHSTDCPKADQRYWRRCRCPKWLAITDSSGRTLRSAKTRSWEQAEEKRSELLRQPHMSPPVETAVQRYLTNLQGRRLSPQTVYRNDLLLGRMKDFLDSRGIKYLDSVTLGILEEYRSTWKVANVTAKFEQARLRAFFRYCYEHHWIPENHASRLAKITCDQPPTQPFTREEYESMLAHAKKPMTHLFIRTLRWSGLAIGDAIRLDKSKLIDGRLFLRRAKTGVEVFCPLPEDVARDLAAVKSNYFFWNERCTLETCRKRWAEKMKRVCLKAGIGQRAHPHMLRDTFAVELLLQGVSVEDVAALLGHASIATTIRYYAPWVRARQERLEASVRKSWSTLNSEHLKLWVVQKSL